MRRVLVLALVVAGCGGDGGAPNSPDPGLAVWIAQGCGSCHTLAAAGSTTDVGPDLDARLAGRDAASIAAVIVDPPPGTVMPEDFGERMSDRELADLAAFLDAAVD